MPSTHPQSTFSPEAIATVAAIIGNQPEHRQPPQTSFSSLCRIAHNLLLAAERFNSELRAAISD
jgi:hypothetical protein